MLGNGEKSSLKRGRASHGESNGQIKKPRRSQRLSSQVQRSPSPRLKQSAQLPSPLTHQASTNTEPLRDGTVTPPEGRPSQIRHRTPVSSPGQNAVSSPLVETQVLSQFIFPNQTFSTEVEDEEEEGVWGYLVPLDRKLGDTLVLRRRSACSGHQAVKDFEKDGKRKTNGSSKYGLVAQEKDFEKKKVEKGTPSEGYLIGRHPECDRMLELPTISNRHCLLFSENRGGDSIAVLEDLSSNGTFVNEAIVGRNKRHELEDGDEITILDEARFIFRYPKNRDRSAFRQQYKILQQLGKGHFATVFLCVEKTTGDRFAVKRFEKRPGEGKRSDADGLQQEIAVLMSVSHPNLLCLKDTFDEEDAVYLVLELAAEGELFNWIVTKQKLSQAETRKVFIQLLQSMKYLHERNIVHRDIKPENILLVDKNLTVKIADFGLAKIIGEESFTTTLCGTPSYVAPEILVNSKQRRYTRAVDVWSLGVVLYICLCGFPPFSDELCSAQNPYTLSQQIKLGKFDYPSPYWDSIGDPALDLIDKMLTVSVDERITIDECLEHPWITERPINPADSTDGLTGAIAQLDFSKRKLARERTLLSTINNVKVRKVIDAVQQPAIKVWEKNVDKPPTSATKQVNTPLKVYQEAKEEVPSAHRDEAEFMEMGGKGDQQLFEDETGSRYPK